MTPRIGPVPKAIALVPLAALSAAWTVQAVRTPAADVSTVAGPSTPSRSVPSPSPTAAPVVPETPLVVPPTTQEPASVWGSAATPPAPPAPPAAVAPAAVTTPTIPIVALAAYQRAAAVIDTADPTCHLDWSLIAGIGRVESDHGSHAGSQLTPDGHATPAIVGPALTGADGTLLVPDTDGGVLDGDARFDHAVGPMQFLPATWSTVGVDGDGDGQRNPQDIDDAALAAGVYLCSGPEDLASGPGQQAALLRYNRSTSYVATVLTFAGQYGAQPAGIGQVAVRSIAVVPGVVLTPETGSTGEKGGKAVKDGKGRKTTKAGTRHGHKLVGATSVAAHADPSDQAAPTVAPANPGAPGAPGTITAAPASAVDLAALCDTKITEAYPNAAHDPEVPDEPFDKALQACVTQLTGQTMAEATKNVEQIVADLLEDFPGLEPATHPTDGPTPAAPGEPTDPAPTTGADPGSGAGPDPAAGQEQAPASTGSTAPESGTETTAP